MRRKLMRAYVMAAISAGLVAGCQSAPWRHSPSHDPVLLSKKSVERKAEATGPDLLAASEPTPPPARPDALALTKPAVSAELSGGSAPPSQAPYAAAVPAAAARLEPKAVLPTPPAPDPPPAVSLIGTAKAPPPVWPAVRPIEPAAVPATVASRQPVVGDYGRAPNYAWLQGVLARHYQGHLELRYADPRTEDHWGGKVCLEPDPRLAQFADGDVILVEGEMLPEGKPSFLGGWHYRHYRVSQVLLIHRGK